MVLFNHAQPALLYLVPGCLLSSLVVAVVSGDFQELWSFNEEHAQQEIIELNDKKKE
jgi:minor histocompatibility antigen H13